MKPVSDALIIHVFALLHAAVALGCRAFGLTDEIALTLLTMLMVVIVCLRRGADVRFMAVSLLLVNVLGFLIGKGWSSLIGLTGASDLVVYPVSTFLTTEILGWGTAFLATRLPRRQNLSGNRGEGIRWLMVAFVLILAIRLALLLTRTDLRTGPNLTASILIDYVFSLGVLIVLAETAIRVSERAREEEEKARLEQYRYLNLSQHVNPHFLFNSLNILDCLVCDGKDSEASDYIHKLAGVYRYLIRNEEERLVSLRDELAFVSEYVELLQVRFPSGLAFSADVPAEALSRKVVPCSLQLLIENAVKHNAVDPARPLHIRLRSDGASVEVTNNLNPKLSQPPSTGLGQKYLRDRYQDVSGEEVSIVRTEDAYTVTIPLI